VKQIHKLSIDLSLRSTTTV